MAERPPPLFEKLRRGALSPGLRPAGLHTLHLGRIHFANVRNAKWTVLVQDTQHFSAKAHELLSQFKFIPLARIDDLMVSFAVKGAGVGPHVDSYDVFLLQGSGSRRWRISSQQDLRLAKGAPLKVLANFKAEQEFVLECGDMLYLPPGFAHDGIAEEDCLTWSIGFRAPSQQELSAALLDFLRDEISPRGLYCDPDLSPAMHPGEIDATMRQRVRKMLVDIQFAARDPTNQLRCLGRYLTDPKPHVFFDAPVPALGAGAFRRAAYRQGVLLDLKTRFLYAHGRFFMNGSEFLLEGVNANLFRSLADNRNLPAEKIAAGDGKEFQNALYGVYADGFLHLAGSSPFA